MVSNRDMLEPVPPQMPQAASSAELVASFQKGTKPVPAQRPQGADKTESLSGWERSMMAIRLRLSWTLQGPCPGREGRGNSKLGGQPRQELAALWLGRDSERRGSSMEGSGGRGGHSLGSLGAPHLRIWSAVSV